MSKLGRMSPVNCGWYPDAQGRRGVGEDRKVGVKQGIHAEDRGGSGAGRGAAVPNLPRGRSATPGRGTTVGTERGRGCHGAGRGGGASRPAPSPAGPASSRWSRASRGSRRPAAGGGYCPPSAAPQSRRSRPRAAATRPAAAGPARPPRRSRPVTAPACRAPRRRL